MVRREYLPLTHKRAEPRRGAGLRALALVGVGWIGIRAFFIIGEDGAVHLRPFPTIAVKGAQSTEPPVVAAPNRADMRGNTVRRAATFRITGARHRGVWQRPKPAWHRRAGPLAIGSITTIERDYMGQLGPLFLFGAGVGVGLPSADEGMAKVSAPWYAPASIAPHGPKGSGGFGLYAYLFWRPDAAFGAAGGAPFTSFGGSQWFVRAEYRFDGAGVARRSGVYARASGPLKGGGNDEFALGAAVQPLARLPLTAHVERRLRPAAPDASAAFISGGVSDIALPHGASLSGYAQGGGVWPDKGPGTAFFDVQTAVTTPLLRSDKARADMGVLASGGGQSGGQSGGPDTVVRLDLGPVVTVSTRQGKAQVEGQLGWRFRVAGDAAPAHGPAVTLSVGF